MNPNVVPAVLPTEVRSVLDIPDRFNFGQIELLKSNIPVKVREPGQDEKYEYYGRKAVPGEHLILQRVKPDGSAKDASPITKHEFSDTYREIPGSNGQFEKTELTRILRLPSGTVVKVHTTEQSCEEVKGPDEAIAFGTDGKPYKFNVAKNTAGEKPDYSAQGTESLVAFKARFQS